MHSLALPIVELPLISIIVPVYNEELNVDLFHLRVANVSATLPDYRFEFIFTDNHSTDATFSKLCLLSDRDERVRIFRFSRNFGYQRSIMTGYLKARGDAAIQLDCDLQDPPELIEAFLERWKAGADVVYGVRNKRKEGWSMNIARSVFYRLIDTLSEDKLPVDAGDFRLVSRRVIEVLRDLDDTQPYLRGTIAAIGFTQVGISYERAARLHGESKFPLSKLVSLALDGILNHSTVPLRLSTYVGMLVSMMTLAGVVIYTLIKLISHAAWPAGFATIVALILSSLSINAMLLGIIGEYLGRMYRQGKKLPLSIIETVVESANVNAEKR